MNHVVRRELEREADPEFRARYFREAVLERERPFLGALRAAWIRRVFELAGYPIPCSSARKFARDAEAYHRAFRALPPT